MKMSCGCRTSIWLSIYGAVVLFVSSVNAYVCRYEEKTNLNASKLFRRYIVRLACLAWGIPQMGHVNQTMYQRQLVKQYYILRRAFREEANYRDHCTVVLVIHFPPQIIYFCMCSTKNVKLVKLSKTDPKTCLFFA